MQASKTGSFKAGATCPSCQNVSLTSAQIRFLPVFTGDFAHFCIHPKSPSTLEGGLPLTLSSANGDQLSFSYLARAFSF